MKIGLIGQPNAGKTTVINNMTGACLSVGNWSGVTVDIQTVTSQLDGQTLEWVDCPGIYDLTHCQEGSPSDHQATLAKLISQEFDVVLNVVDSHCLEQSLYLTLQLREANFPMVVYLTMADKASKQGITLDIEQLSKRLDCPVLSDASVKSSKNRPLLAALLAKGQEAKQSQGNQGWSGLDYPDVIRQYQRMVQLEMAGTQFPLDSQVLALWWLEGCTLGLPPNFHGIVAGYQQDLTQQLQEDVDIIIADYRYQWIQDTLDMVKLASSRTLGFTERMDKLVLNRYLGLPLFFAIIYLMFALSFGIGQSIQTGFEVLSQAFLIDGVSYGLTTLGAPEWLKVLLAGGFGQGMKVLISFIPVVFCLFFFMMLLENTGYMSRAAFLMDRVFKYLGLSGRALMPLMLGFGCNVPGILATRSIHVPQERIITILMAPFMSCSARLVVFSVIVSAFFKTGGHNVIFLLYLTGILLATLTAFLLKRWIFSHDTNISVMELPRYQFPSLSLLSKHVGRRLMHFIQRSGLLIIPTCVFFALINHLTLDDGTSLIEVTARTITPIFSPMGLTQDNWPATVGLLMGTIAKEVVIGAMGALYAGADRVEVMAFDGWQAIQLAVLAMQDSFLDFIKGSWSLYDIMVDGSNDQGFSQALLSHFPEIHGVIAYLLFLTLYIPCLSTVAAIRQELSRFWTGFSVCWSFLLGYGCAVVYYQLATFQLQTGYGNLVIAALTLMTMVLFWYLVIRQIRGPVGRALLTPTVTTAH